MIQPERVGAEGSTLLPALEGLRRARGVPGSAASSNSLGSAGSSGHQTGHDHRFPAMPTQWSPRRRGQVCPTSIQQHLPPAGQPEQLLASAWVHSSSCMSTLCPLCVHPTLMSALRPQLCARIPGKHNPKVWAHKEKHDPTFKKSKLHMEQCCISSSQNQSKAGTSAPGNRGDGFSFSVCVSPKNNGNNG